MDEIVSIITGSMGHGYVIVKVPEDEAHPSSVAYYCSCKDGEM